MLPTRTIYTFAGAGVAVTLTFLTPALPGRSGHALAPGHLPDLGRRRRPTAGRTTSSLYFDASSELAVNTAEQPVTWGRFRLGAARRAPRRLGPISRCSKKSGDNLRIDWGYLYAVAPHDDVGDLCGRSRRRRARASPKTGRSPTATISAPHASPAPRRRPRLRWGLRASRAQPVSRHVVLAYDDVLFDRVLQPAAAALVAPQRGGGRRPAYGRDPGLRPV